MSYSLAFAGFSCAHGASSRAEFSALFEHCLGILHENVEQRLKFTDLKAFSLKVQHIEQYDMGRNQGLVGACALSRSIKDQSFFVSKRILVQPGKNRSDSAMYFASRQIIA